MPDHTPHQKRIIEGYYRHRDDIMLGKLGEVVTELFLVESDRKRDQLWRRVAAAMKSLGVAPSVSERILSDRDAEALARHLRAWQRGSGGSDHHIGPRA